MTPEAGDPDKVAQWDAPAPYPAPAIETTHTAGVESTLWCSSNQYWAKTGVIAKATSRAGEQNLMLGRFHMIEKEGRAGQKSKGGVSKIPNANSYEQKVKPRKNAKQPFCVLPACYARRTGIKSTITSLCLCITQSFALWHA
jgi:hypothetical protein